LFSIPFRFREGSDSANVAFGLNDVTLAQKSTPLLITMPGVDVAI